MREITSSTKNLAEKKFHFHRKFSYINYDKLCNNLHKNYSHLRFNAEKGRENR